jgi:hypothetical protein
MSGENKQPKTFICIDCGIEVKPLRKQRCNSCYKKFKKYGIDWKAVLEQKQIKIIVCTKCGSKSPRIHNGICDNCYKYDYQRKRQAQAPKILCADGCGEWIPSINLKGKPQRFKDNSHRKRENTSQWKGGRWQDDRGYWYVYSPDHPFRTSDGYILEHRLVMEKHIGRYLTKSEIVHHIIPVTPDYCNNDISNLMLLSSQKEHRQQHMTDMSGRKCLICGAKTTTNRDWGIYQNGFICSKCRYKIWSDKRKKKKG